MAPAWVLQRHSAHSHFRATTNQASQSLSGGTQQRHHKLSNGGDIFYGSTWRRLIDTGNAFTVTENANGLTYVRIDPADNVDGYGSAYGRTKAGCEPVIDYSQLTDTATYTIDATENTAPTMSSAQNSWMTLCCEKTSTRSGMCLRDILTPRISTPRLAGNGPGAIIDVAIYGSDKTKPHKVWFIARGPGGPQNWRIIVYRNDGTMASRRGQRLLTR